MPSIFYLDCVNGLDATTDTPLGWWSVAFTGGTAPAPVADEVVTGAISGETAKVTVIGALTGGSWAGGDAAGTMYFYGKSGAFQAEQVNFAGGGHMHIAADFVYCAWKTLTLGATLARIAAGDIIRIAKSTNPVAIGDATWNNLSKIITLAAAQTANIDRCEVAWTNNPAGDATITLTPVAADAKEDANCMKIALDAAVQANIMQAYYATGDLVLNGYQKISFWVKNSGAIVATNWVVNLCSDVAGATVVDSFPIPPIPSTGQWIPLTITKAGGGNLGALIKSIALWSGASTVGMASKNILVDNFIACTTNGLNLQSLISKNGLAQGGTEGFYGIQSINGVTVLLDNATNTKASAGRGYSGTTELVATYIRETIKTDLAALSSTIVQEVMGSGAVGNNIQYQGGFDTALNTQIGETFFDGLNGFGSGIYINIKSFNTLNYLSVCRYNYGIYFTDTSSIMVVTITNANNNTYYGASLGGDNNNVTKIGNANNNLGSGIYLGLYSKVTEIGNANNNLGNGIYLGSASFNTMITIITNANNNAQYGIYFYSSGNNTIGTITNANNNAQYGIYFYSSCFNNKIWSLSTVGNTTGGIFNDKGWNYIYKAAIAEATEVNGAIAFVNSRIFSQMHDGTPNNHWIFTDGGTINSEAVTRVGASGLEWKFLITSANRASNYPLTLSVAKIAVAAGAAVTVKAYLTKSHANNVGAKLVCRGGQIAGVPADVVATKADDVNPEQLTITFTPTEAGTVEIEAWAYYIAANGNVLVDTMEISQA